MSYQIFNLLVKTLSMVFHPSSLSDLTRLESGKLQKRLKNRQFSRDFEVFCDFPPRSPSSDRFQTQYGHAFDIPRQANQVPLPGHLLAKEAVQCGARASADGDPRGPRQSAARCWLPRTPGDFSRLAVAGVSDQGLNVTELLRLCLERLEHGLDLLFVIGRLRQARGHHQHRLRVHRSLCVVGLLKATPRDRHDA